MTQGKQEILQSEIQEMQPGTDDFALCGLQIHLYLFKFNGCTTFWLIDLRLQRRPVRTRPESDMANQNFIL